MASSVSSLTLVGLYQEMIVALGLPLKVAAIILGCIFSMLFSVFNALGPISNPTPPTAAFPCRWNSPRLKVQSIESRFKSTAGIVHA